MFFRFLVREGVVPSTRRGCSGCPSCRSICRPCRRAEQTNALLDGVARTRRSGRFPSAIWRIFELLYGCGLRVSELVGLNLEDIDTQEHWLRVRGKGRKERQVPMAGKAWQALDTYISSIAAAHPPSAPSS